MKAYERTVRRTHRKSSNASLCKLQCNSGTSCYLRFVLVDVVRGHALVVKLAHRFLAAHCGRDTRDVTQRVKVFRIVAADEADVRRDHLRARALVATDPRCSGHQRLGHSQAKCFINSRWKEKRLCTGQ